MKGFSYFNINEDIFLYKETLKWHREIKRKKVLTWSGNQHIIYNFKSHSIYQKRNGQRRCGCCCGLVTKFFCNSIDCNLPGSSVHGISQARILAWVAISFSRDSSPPRDQICVSFIGRWILYQWGTREAPTEHYSAIKDNEIIPIATTLDGLRDCHTE